jgi:serine protease Do
VKTLQLRYPRKGFLLVALAVAGCGEPVPQPVSEPAAVRGQAPSAETFQSVAEAVLPSLVSIQAEARLTPQFGGFLPGMPGPSPDLQPIGAGSGVIYTTDGLILTNDHVVQEAERVTVTLYDRRQFEARVVARDPATDVAVVQIEGNGFTAAPLGDSDRLSLGDWVLALGSPLGLEFTVTAGIVSGTGRALGILGQGRGSAGQAAPLEHFIQTDAAINPGNSGGPLVNLAGEVVGINTAIASPTGVFAGYGFAIPSNLARLVAGQLVEFGEVRRPYLGVLLDNVSAADAEVYGLSVPEGAEVKFIEPGGPAAAAGLQLGDVILAVENRRVATVNDLQAVLAQLPAGATATLRFVRYGQEMDASVRLGVIRSGVAPDPQRARAPAAGLGFAARQVGGAVVVAAVEPFSAAVRAGVRPGQTIIAVNRREVTTLGDLEAAVRAIEGDVISLIIDDPNLGRTIANFRI